MGAARRVYLDHAATSSPKPPAVAEAAARWLTGLHGSPGRGVHGEAAEAGALVRLARVRLATLLGAESPDRVVFTGGCTDAVNLAIRGVVAARMRTARGAGSHIVTTAAEHNAVTRTLRCLAAEPWGVRTTEVPVDPRTLRIDPSAIAAAIDRNTAMVVLSHASNVTGVIQPVAEISRAAHAAGVPVLVDAAQTAGVVPIDVRAMGMDLLAFSGHKGLLGPLGVGGLVLAAGMEAGMDPVRTGGTGLDSEDDGMPEAVPARYEAGSLAVPAIAALAAGVAAVLDTGVEAVHARLATHTGAMLDRLARVPAVHVLGPCAGKGRTAVVSLTHERASPTEFAMALDAGFGVIARAGLHCAPAAHRSLGTLSRGGTVRLSLGWSTTAEEVEAAAEAVAEVARAL